MGSYEGLTNLPAGSSGNANEKSGPKALPDSVRETTEAIVASRCIVTSGVKISSGTATKFRADQVLVTADSGDIGFYLGSSASFATLAAKEVDPQAALATGSLSGSSNYVNFGTNLTARGPIDIHPVAWSGSAADSVVFIYKKGGF